MKNIDLNSIPELPGVYIFKQSSNGKNSYIYIGKAKNLKNRIKNHLYLYSKQSKSFEIINNSDEFEYIVTNSELEAQILESKLIYQYKPYFNIQYKYRNPLKYITVIDSDGYPYFSVEDNFSSNATEILGPFINFMSYSEIFKLLGKLFGVRQCKYDFNKKRPPLCIYYHINMCSGPCQNMISKEEYNKNFKNALDFIKIEKQNIYKLIQEYQQQIRELSEKMEFEKAIIFREKLKTLQKYVDKVIKPYENAYIYYLHEDNINLIGIFFPPSNMKIMEIQNAEELTPVQIIFNTILNMNSQRIFIQQEFLQELKEFTKSYCQKYNDDISKKLKEIEIDFIQDENFEFLRKSCLNKLEYYKRNDVYVILKSLSQIVEVEIIYRIEVVDVSHFYGQDVYGALVVFEKNKFEKSKYRVFKLHNKFDDFSNIYELIYRRFKNNTDNSLSFYPQLMIIDGGPNQLKFAYNAYKDANINADIKFMSIAKPEDKIYLLKEKIYEIKVNQNVLNFIRKLRDEAHRFANSRRIKYSKGVLI